ncbi:MAG: ABC transporter permease [Dissulfuribacterales bacterium]
MHPLGNIWFLTLLTLKEGIRHRALRAFFVLAGVLFVINLLVTELFSWDLTKVSIEFGLSTVAFCGLLLIFVLGMKLMSDDLERHTIYFVLARPVSRGQYVIGKYCGIGMILLFATLILGAGSALSVKLTLWHYAAFVPPNFSWWTFLLALGFQWLSLMVILAISLFWFSYASQSFTAILLSVFSYLVGQNMELLRGIDAAKKGVGEASLLKGIFWLVSWIFPNLSFFDMKVHAAYGLSVDYSEILWIIGYGLSYAGIILLLTILCFNRKDLG